MKYKLLLSFCLLVILSCQAQHQIDTVKVYRLITYATDRAAVFGVRILEVRELHNQAEGLIDPGYCLNCNYQDYWRHLKYLDLNKQPFKKGIVIINPDIEADQEPEPPPAHCLPSSGESSHDTIWGIKAQGWIIDSSVTSHTFPPDFTHITDKEDPDNLAKNGLYSYSDSLIVKVDTTIWMLKKPRYDTVLETRWVWNRRKFDRDTREPKKVYALYPYIGGPIGFLGLKKKRLNPRYWVIGGKVI